MRPTVLRGSGEVDAAMLERIRTECERALGELAPVFPELPRRAFHVFVHQDRAGMPDALQALLHQDSPGFALLGQHQIHLVLGELRRTGTSLRGVVVHELVHELLDQYTAPYGAGIPRWFHEGLAQFLAGDTYLGAREEDLVWRVGTRRLLSFGELRRSFPSDPEALRTAYAQSYSYVAWLARRYGLAELLKVARAADDRTSFDRALVGRLDRTTLELEDAWRDHLLRGSGAPWRILLEQCFSILLLAALPVLVLALMRRLQAEQKAARRLRVLETEAAAAAAARAAVAELHDDQPGEREHEHEQRDAMEEDPAADDPDVDDPEADDPEADDPEDDDPQDRSPHHDEPPHRS